MSTLEEEIKNDDIKFAMLRSKIVRYTIKVFKNKNNNDPLSARELEKAILDLGYNPPNPTLINTISTHISNQKGNRFIRKTKTTKGTIQYQLQPSIFPFAIKIPDNELITKTDSQHNKETPLPSHIFPDLPLPSGPPVVLSTIEKLIHKQVDEKKLKTNEINLYNLFKTDQVNFTNNEQIGRDTPNYKRGDFIIKYNNKKYIFVESKSLEIKDNYIISDVRLERKEVYVCAYSLPDDKILFIHPLFLWPFSYKRKNEEGYNIKFDPDFYNSIKNYLLVKPSQLVAKTIDFNTAIIEYKKICKQIDQNNNGNRTDKQYAVKFIIWKYFNYK